MIQFVRRDALLQLVQHQPGIHRAAAGGHHQPLQGREAHGGGDAARRATRRQHDGAERTAGPQVAADQAPGARPLGGHGFAHVLVVEAVEAEAPQALLAPGQGQGIGVVCRGDRGVEGCVEAGPLLRLRVPLHEPAHHLQGRAVVQRRQGHQGLDCRQHLPIQPAGRREPLASVHHPVPHQLDRLPVSGQLGGQPVVEDGLGRSGLAGLPVGVTAPHRGERPVAAARGQQLSLEAGAAGIEHQHQQVWCHPSLRLQRQLVTSGESMPWAWA